MQCARHFCACTRFRSTQVTAILESSFMLVTEHTTETEVPQQVPAEYYTYAGFPYHDREELFLWLDSNVNEHVSRSDLDGTNITDELLVFSELQ